MNAVSPGYFEAMKIPLLEGRDFTRADEKPVDEDHPWRVCIVNKKFADHFFPGQERRSAGTWVRAPGRTPSSTSRSSASSPTRSTKVRATACTGRCSCRTTATDSVTFYVRAQMASASIYNADSNEVRNLDAGNAGLRDEVARDAAGRNAAVRSARRAALGGLRHARDACWRRSASTA